jgi:diguanylate cyclase (GGDEF)-like protein
MLRDHRLSALFLRVWKARRAQVSRVFPLGIAARLSAALFAVAVLAGIANLLVSQSAVLIRTGSVSSALPVIVPPAPPIPAAPAPISRPAPAPVVHISHALEDDALVAIDRFEWIARRRAESESKEIIAEYVAATAKLRKLSSPKAGRFDDYLNKGAALVRIGDTDRSTRQDYEKRLEAIDEGINTSLDHAWHVFGRVIARQSLMKLHGDADALRQRGQKLNSTDAFGPEQDAALANAETLVAQEIETQRATLSRSQGAEWLDGIKADLDALPALRLEMSQYAGALSLATEEFERSRTTLSMEIKRVVAAKEARSAAAEQGEAGTADAPLPRQSVHAPLPAVTAAALPNTAMPLNTASPVPIPAAAMSPVALPRDSTAVAVLAQSDPRTRTLMAAVTAALVLLIAVICVFTVRSVLLPVKRILRATRRLAQGDPQARVSPGGIRELASLAVAFNDMAARLEVAQRNDRQQQENLEAQVIERTHQLQQLAHTDPLTSLPNRRRLFEILNGAISRAEGSGGSVGVYFIDIDNFKNYNDSLGHVFGDRVLMSVANRVEEITDGKGFVARFGGDEFTVVYEHTGGLDAVRDFGLALVDAFHQLLPVDERELSVSVSVGASASPMHATDAGGLLRAADAALFRAKELGRSQLVVFTSALAETAAVRFATEQGLRRALERGEFELLYQPEIDLATFEMGLVEALLRWRMPDGRLAAPGEFLAIAEQSGLIVDINDWVLRTAVERAADWHRGAWPNARVAVNVTPRQLLDERFTDRVLALLSEFDLPPRCIELELTESVLQTGPGTIAVLRRLQSHGICIALDDFGTGYSSLTSLEQLPLSRIKLDRSLIVNVDTSPRSAAIAKAILELCAGLELEVTVEGIETSEQFAWLLSQRNLYVQGYLLSVPVTAAEIVPLKSSLSEKMHDLLLTVGPGRRSAPFVPALTQQAIMAKG